MAFNRLRGTINPDGTTAATPSRTDPYGGAYATVIGAGDYFLADEGSLYTCTNATLATGIAGHAAPVVADTDTKALLHVFNGSSDKFIIPVSLFLEVTAAGTGGTIHYTTIYVDNAGATARASGGTQITALNNCNAENPYTSSATVYFGAVVTSAHVSSKKVGQQLVREVIPVVQDTVLMKFGGTNTGEHSSLTTAGTATNHCVQHFPALSIGPGGNLNISQIRASQSAAASYQFQFTWIER